MKNVHFPDSSLSNKRFSDRFTAEAAIVFAPFALCITLIGSLPWIAG